MASAFSIAARSEGGKSSASSAKRSCGGRSLILCEGKEVAGKLLPLVWQGTGDWTGPSSARVHRKSCHLHRCFRLQLILLYRRRPVMSVRRSGLKVSLPETRLLKLALLRSTQKLSEGACTTRAEAPKMLRFKSCPTFKTKKQEGFWDKNEKMSLWQGLPEVTFNFNPSSL